MIAYPETCRVLYKNRNINRYSGYLHNFLEALEIYVRMAMVMTAMSSRVIHSRRLVKAPIVLLNKHLLR